MPVLVTHTRCGKFRSVVTLRCWPDLQVSLHVPSYLPYIKACAVVAIRGPVRSESNPNQACLAGRLRPRFIFEGLHPLPAQVLAGGAYTAWLLYQAPFMRQLWIYLLGALFVFWFSVSGGMHNIIRGVPLYFFNQQGQVRAMEILLICVHYFPSRICVVKQMCDSLNVQRQGQRGKMLFTSY